MGHARGERPGEFGFADWTSEDFVDEFRDQAALLCQRQRFELRDSLSHHGGQDSVIASCSKPRTGRISKISRFGLVDQVPPVAVYP